MSELNTKVIKIQAGSLFPDITVTDLEGRPINLGLLSGAKPDVTPHWKMVIVYRGRHCPLCTKYLNTLSEFTQRLVDTGVELVAVSADSEEQLQHHLSKLKVNFPLYHGLTVEQMQALGLYISVPLSDQETDHLFAEPGLFVINDQGQVQVVDISNNPFVRPDLESLISGLEWIRNPENNYPIRGTY